LRTLKDAQKNIRWFSVVLIAINFLFLSLGALLYLFAHQKGIPLDLKDGKIITDAVFPTLALNHLGTFAAIVFILGLIASTFSSADSVLTSLTTSFMIDYKVAKNKNEKDSTKIRHIIHISFAVLLLIVILIFKAMNNDAIINTILSIATFTYGPLLGLFAFGIFTKWEVRDSMTPIICVISPLVCYYLSMNSKGWFNGYEYGHEILILNGALTFLGLLLFRKNKKIEF
jgi:Na+/proline symporter